jgi:hypothetical protein
VLASPGRAAELGTPDRSAWARAAAMGEAMKFRSRLKEGPDIVIDHGRPSDALEMHDWMAKTCYPCMLPSTRY